MNAIPLKLVCAWSIGASVLLCAGCEVRETKGPPPQKFVVNLDDLVSEHEPRPKATAWNPDLDVAADACDESKDEHELVGKWKLLTSEIAGRPATTDGYYEFKGNQMRVVEGTLDQDRTFEIDPNANPKMLDSRLTVPQGTMVIRAIYRIDGDVLTISDATTFRARPDRFVEQTTVENDYGLCTLKRVTDKD